MSFKLEVGVVGGEVAQCKRLEMCEEGGGGK